MEKLRYYAVSDWNMKHYCDLIVDVYKIPEVLSNGPMETSYIFDIKMFVLKMAELKVWDKKIKFCEDPYGK